MAVSLDTPANSVGQHIPYAGGDLGVSFDLNDKAYEIVDDDSGATSATPVGAVAANQVAFWKDRANRIVTNDNRMAIGAAAQCFNFVAGIFRCAVATPGAGGTLVCVLTKGYNIPVASDNSGTIGLALYADATASTARLTSTAPQTYAKAIAVARGSGGAGSINADVDIANLP
jgi:hypothetical protein